MLSVPGFGRLRHFALPPILALALFDFDFRILLLPAAVLPARHPPPARRLAHAGSSSPPAFTAYRHRCREASSAHIGRFSCTEGLAIYTILLRAVLRSQGALARTRRAWSKDSPRSQDDMAGTGHQLRHAEPFTGASSEADAPDLRTDGVFRTPVNDTLAPPAPPRFRFARPLPPFKWPCRLVARKTAVGLLLLLRTVRRYSGNMSPPLMPTPTVIVDEDPTSGCFPSKRAHSVLAGSAVLEVSRFSGQRLDMHPHRPRPLESTRAINQQ